MKINPTVNLRYFYNNFIGKELTLSGMEGYISEHVNVFKEEDIIYIESTAEVNGVSNTVTLQFANYSSENKSITISGSSGGYSSILESSIYMWGNLHFNSGPIIMFNSFSDPSTKLNIKYCGSLGGFSTWDSSSQLKDIIFTKIESSIPPIQIPPESVWKDGVTVKKPRLDCEKTITSNGPFSLCGGIYGGDFIFDHTTKLDFVAPSDPDFVLNEGGEAQYYDSYDSVDYNTEGEMWVQN